LPSPLRMWGHERLGLSVVPPAFDLDAIAAYYGRTRAQLYGHAGFAAVALGIVYLSWYMRQPPKSKKALTGEWQDFKLADKTEQSANVNLYKFELRPHDTLGLPAGKHIQVQAECNGKMVSRSYTPTSREGEKGFFELLIKTYPKGNISQHMAKMNVGDKLSCKGPRGSMEYKPDLAPKIGMLAGGTGITPMLSIVRASMDNPSDKTEISLIYANISQEDILVKAELDELAESNERFKVYYVLDKPPEGWKGGEGFVTKDMISEHCPKPDKENKILICGPPPMVKAMVKNLTELGYDEPRTVSKPEDQVFSF